MFVRGCVQMTERPRICRSLIAIRIVWAAVAAVPNAVVVTITIAAPGLAIVIATISVGTVVNNAAG